MMDLQIGRSDHTGFHVLFSVEQPTKKGWNLNFCHLKRASRIIIIILLTPLCNELFIQLVTSIGNLDI